MKQRLRTIAAAAALASGSAVFALPADIRLTPADGSTLEQIDEFTVSSGWLELKYNTTRAEILVNGRTIGADTELVGYENIRFILDEAVTTNGTYDIMIEPDTFLIGWENDPNPLITFTYTVENDHGSGEQPGQETINNTVPAGYIFTPAAGQSVETLAQFSIEALSDLFLTPASRHCPITINGNRVDAIASVSGQLDNILTWTLASPVTEPGLYNIYVPEGTFFGYDEEDNEYFLVTVRVTGGEAPELPYFEGIVTADPASGSNLENLSRIAVMYPKLTSAYLGPRAGDVTVAGPNGEVQTSFTLTPDPDDFNEAHVIWLDFATPLAVPGTYTISFPPCCFEIAKYPLNKYSAPFTLTYYVTDGDAVEEISAEYEECEYYSLQGMRLDAPARGTICLERRGSGVKKIRKQ